MEWNALGILEDGKTRIKFNHYDKPRFQEYVAANGPIRLTITHDLPESTKLRA